MDANSSVLAPIRKGHLRVGLARDGKVTDFTVRRLVAMAFLPNPERLPCVRHIDFNCANVSVSNLQWCTQREALARAQDAGRLLALVFPSRAKSLTAELADEIYVLRKGGMKFNQIASTLGVSEEACRKVC